MIQAKRLANGKLVQVMPDGTEREFVSQTDWAAFDAQTDEEVMAAVLSDPDAVVLTDEERRERHVPNVRKIRQKLQLTQEQFAERFQVPIGTLRDWEQGVTLPDKAARSYLRVIAKNPQAVVEALAG
jgi:putative transcriptional regulator